MSKWLEWTYHDRAGKAVFQTYRVTDRSSPRGKRYGYRYPEVVVGHQVTEWVWQKHPKADTLLYRLPLVLANPDADLLSVEGERDVDAAVRPKLALATSHHGGAGKFTEAQAQSLAGHR